MHRLLILCAVAVVGCSANANMPADAGPTTQFDAKPGLPDAISSANDAHATIDAAPITMPDAGTPSDAAQVPDARANSIDAPPVIDAPPNAIDAAGAIDGGCASASDPVCDNSVGDHCDTVGNVVTCAESEGCFHTTGPGIACPGNESCVAGACECPTDSRCAAGLGAYCDPAGKTYSCTQDDTGCVAASVAAACPDSKTCTGAAGSAMCTCPALGAAEGRGCTNLAQLSCDPISGNVIKCTAVDSCNVWQSALDCGSLALTCNNNQCVCPSNTSHNFYVGPNYKRAGAPDGLSPNGLLTSNGLCTFPTLGEGLFAAASDALFTNPAVARVIAVALPAQTATFEHETFPLVVGNRTVLTTYEDPDPNVGGPGFRPTDFTISYNAIPGGFAANPEGTARLLDVAGVVVDPLLSSGAQTVPAPAGGYAGFSGFTVMATQANIGTAELDDGEVTGGLYSVVAAGGEVHLGSLRLLGGGTGAGDRSPDDLTTDVLVAGLLLVDHSLVVAQRLNLGHARPIGDDATNAGGPWGSFDKLFVSGYGNFDAGDAILDSTGAGVVVATLAQGSDAGGVAHRAVFTHLEVHDSQVGLELGAGAVTLADDPTSPVPNLVAGAPYQAAGAVTSTMSVGVQLAPLELPGTPPTDGQCDLDATGLFVQNALSDGIYVASPVPASVARFTRGEISGTLAGDGLLDEGAGAAQAGGLSVDSTLITDNHGIGVHVDNRAGAAFVTATNVTIQRSGDDGLRAELSDGHDGAVSVEFDGGAITLNGTLLDSTDDVHAQSSGNGVAVAGGASFTSTNATTISGNVLSGLTSSGDGAVLLDGTLLTGNGQDTCAGRVARTTPTGITGDQAYSCRAFALVVGSSGGFTARDGVRVDANLGPGVRVTTAAGSVDDSGLPLQTWSGGSISNNGGGAVRDDQASSTGSGGNTQGCLIDPGARLLLSDRVAILGNKGVGLDVAGGLASGDLRVDGNGANDGILDGDQAPVATPQSGVVIEATGLANLTGSVDNGVTISNSARHGLVLAGELHATYIRSMGNAGDGLHVAMPRPTGSTVDNAQLDGNGVGASGGDGLAIAYTSRLGGGPADLAACAQAPDFALTGDRPTLRSKTSVHDNLGNGVTVGSPDGAVQQGRVCASIGDADVFANHGSGLITGEPSTDAPTFAVFLDDDAYTNGANGLFVGPSFVGQATPAAGDTAPATFRGNKLHSNGLNQAVFDGGGDGVSYNIDSPTGACDAGANAFYCYSGMGTFGVFAQGGASLAVHHAEFAGGGVGLSDFGAQSGSFITVDNSCTAFTVCP